MPACIGRAPQGMLLTTQVVNMDSEDRLQQDFRELGWADNEIRAYLALLRLAEPVTAYRVARTAGLPTAKVYGALDRLERRGAVRRACADRGARYSPVSAWEMITGMRANQDRLLNGISARLAAIAAAPAEYGQPEELKGGAGVAGRANAILAEARLGASLVCPAGWEPALRPGLAAIRAPLIRVHSPTDAESRRLLAVTADGAQSLVALVGSERETAGLFAPGPVLAALCEALVARQSTAQAGPQLGWRQSWIDYEAAKQKRLLPATV